MTVPGLDLDARRGFPAAPGLAPGALSAEVAAGGKSTRTYIAWRGVAALVGGRHDVVEVRDAVLAELERPQVDPALLRLDAFPGGEGDDEVGPLRVERLVGGCVEGHGLEGGLAAIRLDHGLERRHLVR